MQAGTGEEQRALLRVATLVARRAPQDEVFVAIVEEVAQALGAERVVLARLDAGDTQPLSTWGTSDAPPAGRPRLEVPVVVGGRPWGVLSAWSSATANPGPDAEAAVARFAELAAAALADEDAHAQLRRLADEQRALRRVAELVARGASQPEVLEAVVREAFALLDVDFTALSRYEHDGSATIVAQHGAPAEMAAGTVVPPADDGILPRVLRTGRPVRIDTYEGLPGEAAATARRLAVDGGAGAPIRIDGRVWGVMSAMAWRRPVPAGLEDRLAEFAQVAATAIAGAQARGDLRRLADEQAALRRLAELAARGAAPAEVFDAIVTEASRLLGHDAVGLARYDEDGSAKIVALHGDAPWPAAGRQGALGADALMDRVRSTGRAVRVDDGGQLPGDAPGLGHALGLCVAAGAPVHIDGRVWGVLMTGAREGTLAPGAETDLERFAELLGTAISGAQARTALQDLVAEQAALRRVAELVARGAGQEELFDAVAREASRLADGNASTLLRVDEGGWAAVVATFGAAPAPVGTRVFIAGDDAGVVAEILRTGRPARLDDYARVSGPAYARDDWGVGASVGVPITVDDRIWGVLGFTAGHGRLPLGAERRLQQFADLIAAALGNVQARAEAQELADDQAALRRVAELVARGTDPAEVFTAVATEASRLLRDEPMTLTRFVGDHELVVVALSGGPAPVGDRIVFQADTLPDRILRTGRPSRVDDYTRELDAELAVQYGLKASVAVPIAIEGAVWGMLTATSSERPLPPGTEVRLAQFAELVAAAIANAESRAQLTASRARVVATADEVRRRLQRDVHDGAQQRLVQTVVTLKLAQQALRREASPAAELVDESLLHAEQATAELADLVRGILPAALTRGGLQAGLESLAGSVALPVDLRVDVPRLPPGIETTAYFVVAEALTNVVKHAEADRASVVVAVDDAGQTLTVEVHDDGAGGARPAAGTGLTGLFDRVGAADGTLTVDSLPGEGTTVRATMPIGGGR